MGEILYTTLTFEELTTLFTNCVKTELQPVLNLLVKKNVEESPYMTMSEFSEKYHITKQTIIARTKLGLIPAYRFGHRVLYKQHEIDSLMKKINI